MNLHKQKQHISFPFIFIFIIFINQACFNDTAGEKNKLSGKINNTEKGVKNGFVLLDRNDLILARKAFQNGDAFISEQVKCLMEQANKLLLIKPYSVMQKSMMPPSGTKHDFYSLGPYWWPNPETENGLPYIRKDGVRNPEYEKYDGKIISEMAEAVNKLALAFFYTQNTAYAQKAIELLQVWFINVDTYMKPNLNFGQAIPGITQGRGIGIIETACFVPLIDNILLLQDSGVLDAATFKGLTSWFTEYNHWLLNSPIAWDERMWPNNHGSAFDSQVAAYSLLTHNDSALQIILDSVPIKRMAKQIKADGSQPFELERTKSMGYSLYNLEHLAHCAIIAQNHQKNFWNMHTDTSGSIVDAIKFLIPFFTEDKKWEYEQIGGIAKQASRLMELLYLTNKHCSDTAMYKAMIQLKDKVAFSCEFILSYPPLSIEEKKIFDMSPVDK